jgi:cytochrome c-type biogenesis protein CcmF
MFRIWNMVLVVVTYLLVILGTFIVRSGVISSVHSFAESAVGPLFFAFLSIMLIFSVYWIIRRSDELGSPNRLRSYVSREGAFLLNNFLFLYIAGVVLWGTIYPILSEWVTGEKVTMAAPFYNSVFSLGWAFIALLLLMGVAPLTMWYRSSLQRIGMQMVLPAVIAAAGTLAAAFVLGVRSWGALIGLFVVSLSAMLTIMEFWKGLRARMKRGEGPLAAFSNLMARNRRRYGGYWIHLGVLIMAFGIIGSYFYQQETQIRLGLGESVSLGAYEMTFNGVRQFPGPDDLQIKEADVAVSYRGEYVRDLTPRTELYTRSGQPMTIPSVRSTISEDFYVILVNWESVTASEATFRIFLNPLINWIWAGGFVFIFGTLVAAWPDAVDEKVSAAARARRRVATQPA